MKPAFENTFSEKKEVSHDIDRILGGGLLNMMMLDSKLGREGKKIGKT